MKVFETRLSNEDLIPINEVLLSGDLGFGSNVSVVEEEFKNFSKKDYNVATNSASAAAFLIFAHLKERYGICDVYTPSLAFTSPAWAAKHFGHNLIWVDVNDSLLFDIEHYKSIKEDRVCRYGHKNQIVLMPILYGGVSTIEGFDELEDEIVVTDSAHCVTPTIKCDYSFFSFHPYKPLASSDGGMISTNDLIATEYFRNYRNFGRSNINGTYDITQEGFKFYMNNLNATILLTQMKKYGKLLQVRKQNFSEINLEEFGRLLPHDEQSSYYFATLICNKESVGHMKDMFPTSTHYPMLHKTEYYSDSSNLHNTELIHNYIVNIPII